MGGVPAGLRYPNDIIIICTERENELLLLVPQAPGICVQAGERPLGGSCLAHRLYQGWGKGVLP